MGLALGVLLFGGLGSWQLSRLSGANQTRAALELRLAEEPFDASSPPVEPDWRRGRVSGDPEWDRYVLVGPTYDGDRIGFDLIVPVRWAGGAVLVDLGWVPAATDGVVSAPAEAVVDQERKILGGRTFEGLARTYPPDPSAPGRWPKEAGGFQRTWAAVDPAAMAQGSAVAPFILVEGQGRSEGAPVVDRVPPIGGWEAAPHRRPHGEYAATWFGILACLVGLWAYGSFRDETKE